eukprot:scaffold134314_cov56-Attheya_sp.AAC.1
MMIRGHLFILKAIYLGGVARNSAAFVPNGLTAKFSRTTAKQAVAGEEALNNLDSRNHDFHLERSYYRQYLGGVGTMPSQQGKYGTREAPPRLVCKRCKKPIDTALCDGSSNGIDHSFQLEEWKDKYMVPENPADLDGTCGEIVTFKNDDYYNTPLDKIQLSLLKTKHPDAMLTRLIMEQWDDKPFSDIIISCNTEYFPFVLKYIQEGYVCLPSCLFKDCFLTDLSYYGIDFDPDMVEEDLDPTIMAIAVFANKDRLDGFQNRIIKGDLQKKLDDAQTKFDAAVDAHLIVDRYIKARALGFYMTDLNPVLDWHRLKNNANHLHYCNAFLEQFGVSIANIEDVRNQSEYLVQLKLM